MAFSDLQTKTVADFCMQKLMARMTSIQDFAHNYRETEMAPYSGVVIPSLRGMTDAAEFNETSNNYGSGSNEFDGITVTLDKHYVKSLAVSDADLAQTRLDWAREAGIAIGDAIGKAANDYVVGLINTTNISAASQKVVIGGTAKQNFADLFATANEKGLDVSETVLMLTPSYFAKLLGTLDANVYGGVEAIRGGRIPGLYGFKAVVNVPNMTTTGDVVGALCDVNSIGVATRLITPMAGAYPSFWTAVDDVNGLAVGMREFEDLAKGKRYVAGDILIGAKIADPKGIVLLTSK